MSNPARTAKLHPEMHHGKGLAARPGGLTTSPGGLTTSLAGGTHSHWSRVPSALCAVLLLGLAQPASAKSDSVPDWVRAAAAQTLPHYPAETNAVVLLEETTYTVAPDGRAVEHVRHVVKILRPQGRGEAVVHVGFDKDTKILSMNPRVLGSLAIDTDHKLRTVPFNLGETMQATDEYSIELPDGYVVDEIPDPVRLDLGFAAYHSAIDVKGNTPHYTRTYTVRQVTLPADRYADVQKLARAIATDEESRTALKKTMRKMGPCRGQGVKTNPGKDSPQGRTKEREP